MSDTRKVYLTCSENKYCLMKRVLTYPLKGHFAGLLQGINHKHI